MVKRSSLGRQKIAMEKIPKKNHLQVTFSKRRSGLFKKASELCTLCGAEIAIIVFSPANKAFSFGYPGVDSILDRFLGPSLPFCSTNAGKLIKAHRNANVNELNMELTHTLNQLEAEKKHGEALDQVRKCGQNMCWWEKPIDELCFSELNQLKDALFELKKHVQLQANMMMVESANPNPMFFGGNGMGFVSDNKVKFNDLNHAASSNIPDFDNFGYDHRSF
ncbi:MADS-box transcription factor family protein [Euphorbia peplus]|nr:MADS-box transcription factor family protein [Euphorbia peplus]